jgi:opacity protein-like surface antigen
VAIFRAHSIHNRIAPGETMKKVLLALCAAVLLAASAMAQDVTAPIHQILDSFDTNDMKAVAASYATGDISITDEVAPFHWNGPKANDAWAPTSTSTTKPPASLTPR